MPKGKSRYSRHVYKTRPEWLRARVIGGSSASSIVGVNPWQSRLELYLSLMEGPGDDRDNEVLKYGRENEPLIRKMFKLDFPDKKVMAPRGYEMYIRNDKPYMTATVDGRTVDSDGRKGILEIKTHDVRNSEDLDRWRGSIPQNYLFQVLHYMLVLTDYEYADLVAKLRFFDYDGTMRTLVKTETRYYHIERADVEKELAWLEKQETRFYEENFLKGIPPQPNIVL